MSVYDEVFAALDAADVPFVVVGGVAVVLHGHARLTVDLDLVIDLAAEPAAAAVDALLTLGLRPRLPVDARDFADEAIRSDWVVHRNLQVFTLYDPVNPLREVDLFATEPLPFTELFAQAVAVTIGATTVRVASIPHLVALKQRAGRPQDLEDIAALEALAEARRADSTENDVSRWQSATYMGANTAMRAAVAVATASERLAWLDQALLLAEASGALTEARREKQQGEAAWAGTAQRGTDTAAGMPRTFGPDRPGGAPWAASS